jgi:hypothetical protein
MPNGALVIGIQTVSHQTNMRPPGHHSLIYRNTGSAKTVAPLARHGRGGWLSFGTMSLPVLVLAQSGDGLRPRPHAGLQTFVIRRNAITQRVVALCTALPGVNLHALVART